jgi:two-component system, cell cycle sensor histidine kinase and response regulator CckA
MDKWLSEHLGLAVLWEDERGGVVGNAPAARLLGHASFGELSVEIANFLSAGMPANGSPAEAPATSASDLAAQIARARAGLPSEINPETGRRALLVQAAPGSAMVVLSTTRLQPDGLDASDLAAGVSHELANALAAIAGWARLAKQGRKVHEALGLIQMSAESAWSAAQRLLRDLRGQPGSEAETVDLSAFVDEAARLLGPKAMAKNVQVRTVIEPGLQVQGNRGSAWSIVWNLALNAVEALPPGGSVELRLTARDDSAILVVEDDGPGMDPRQRERAFEPYFTTKESGTGLGLPMVRRAVDEVGGSIELHSAEGSGTRFTVALLRAAGAARSQPDKHTSGVFFTEPIDQRILVVEDDLGLREMIATALGMRGAEVVAVDSPDAALAQAAPFAIAIIDLLLPGMRGDAVLARLREARLVQRGMLMTGTELPSGIASGGQPEVLLRKPFELEELFEGVAAALAADPAQRRVG